MDELADSFKQELRAPSFSKETEFQLSMKEKEWPLGPTCSINDAWPFIFITSESVNGLLIFCALVGLTTATERAPLIDLPEVTAGFGVLEEIKNFLPVAEGSFPTETCISRFLYLLKTALPFGSPVFTNIDILNQIEQTSVAANDSIIMTHCSSVPRSSVKIPSWKPFPFFSGGTCVLRLHIVESVAFEVLDGDVRNCTVGGVILCESDLSGTPEVLVPIHVSIPHQTLSLHDCAKFAGNAHDDIVKISFIPPNGSFNLASYEMTNPLKMSQFPLDLSFQLLQISPTQFKFSLSAKLRVLFAQFSILFCVHENVGISNIILKSHSPKWKADISNETHVSWNFKNPSTYSDGETVNGVIETVRPLFSHEEISKSAVVSLRIANDHFSRMKVIRESITFFPPIAKTSIPISHETVSTGGCLILNSALDLGPSASAPIDLNDCINLVSA
jgi:hypothetical protein